jgi:urease accessory protein
MQNQSFNIKPGLARQPSIFSTGAGSNRGAASKLCVTLVLMSLASTAYAHSGEEGANGFLAGVLHPVTGFDHLLAMVAVGIWGATLGRPLIWVLPVAFPMLMVVGGVLGITGVAVPFIETGIAISVIVLGLAIAAAWRAPTGVAVTIVAVFGVFHGYAHGAELPSAASPAAYVAGFVLCTGALHLAGIGIGALKGLPKGPQGLRICGGLIALAGAWILAGMPGMS